MADKKDSSTIATGHVQEKEKLVQASVNILNPDSQSGYLFNQKVDRMEVPEKYHDLIKVCRFFYKRDPIAGTVLNKLVDCAITPLNNRQGECSDEEFEVYNAINDMLQEFFRNVCLEYLLSGMVVPHYEWIRIRGSELSQKLNSRRRVTVPDNIWFRDPATITVKRAAIPNKRYYYVTVDSKTIAFIRNNGKYSDGTVDKETYDELVKNYPEFVKAVKALKGTTMKIKLEDIRPILAKTLPEEDYPLPYMANALESLMHKRNLKRMDYSIAARVIAAIQLIKLGSDEFPCTDDTDFDQIKHQMNYRTNAGQAERIYQLFANHTLVIEWVFPDTEAMLNREKYSLVDDDIIAAFGFPRTLITGETIRSNVSGGSDFAAFSPIASMEAIRDRLVEWTKELYREIQSRNKFKNRPEPKFSPMRLYKLLDLNTIGQALYQEGNISRKSREELVGIDYETELERKSTEEQEYKDRGIEPAPVLPFSSPQIGQPGAPSQNKSSAEVEFDLPSALASMSPEQIAEHYQPLEDFAYLIHHVEVDEKGKEILHHCLLYDHIANMFEQSHLVLKDGKAYMNGKVVEEGRYHVITDLEPTQEVLWSDEEANGAGVTPKRMHSGMTLKEKAKEW